MTSIPLMVELCAGTAALSLRLHRDGARKVWGVTAAVTVAGWALFLASLLT